MSALVGVVLGACLIGQEPAGESVAVPPVGPQPAPEVTAAQPQPVPEVTVAQPVPAPEVKDRAEEPPRGRFVFGFLPAVTAGVSQIPSINLPFFFGARLRSGWALGYQFTFSSGFAERYWLGLITHRHHVTGLRSFGRRGFASVGGGVALLMIRPVIEVEGRVAVRFGRRGVFGGLARLGWSVAYGERAPMPQLGLFVGLTSL